MTLEGGLLATLAEDLQGLADSVDAAHRAAAEGRRRAARSLRDELRDLTDDRVMAEITCADGSVWPGTIDDVGLDHLRISDGGETRLVALFHIVAVSYPA